MSLLHRLQQRIIAGMHRSAQGVTEQLAVEVTEELVLVIDEIFLQAERPIQNNAIVRCGDCRKRAAIAITFSPAANGIEVFQRNSQGVDLVVAGGTGRNRSVAFELFENRFPLSIGVVFRKWFDIRRRIGKFAADDLFHDPNPALHGTGPQWQRALSEKQPHTDQTAATMIRWNFRTLQGLVRRQSINSVATPSRSPVIRYCLRWN